MHENTYMHIYLFNSATLQLKHTNKHTLPRETHPHTHTWTHTLCFTLVSFHWASAKHQQVAMSLQLFWFMLMLLSSSLQNLLLCFPAADTRRSESHRCIVVKLEAPAGAQRCAGINGNTDISNPVTAERSEAALVVRLTAWTDVKYGTKTHLCFSH